MKLYAVIIVGQFDDGKIQVEVYHQDGPSEAEVLGQVLTKYWEPKYGSGISITYSVSTVTPHTKMIVDTDGTVEWVG